jgi:hypothetical protein
VTCHPPQLSDTNRLHAKLLDADVKADVHTSGCTNEASVTNTVIWNHPRPFKACAVQLVYCPAHRRTNHRNLKTLQITFQKNVFQRSVTGN